MPDVVSLIMFSPVDPPGIFGPLEITPEPYRIPRSELIDHP
jgi:hypothetical protein